MSADWEVVFRIRCRDLVEHDEPDAEAVARWVIEEEGIFGVADNFSDWDLVSITPVADKEGAGNG